ncbi:MAG: hypothetical protein AAFQ81_09310 [Pseudomonadota bacterium]
MIDKPVVTIEDREFTLTTSRDKKKLLNRQLGGLIAAVNKLAAVDLDAIAQIISIGADLGAKDREFVADAVYDVEDLASIVTPVREYLGQLMSLRKGDEGGEGNGKKASTSK